MPPKKGLTAMTDSTRLMLHDVCGPLKDLLSKLNGDAGELWLRALGRFLRKEDPWKLFDSCPSIVLGDRPRTVNDYKDLMRQYEIWLRPCVAGTLDRGEFTILSEMVELDFAIVSGRIFGTKSTVSFNFIVSQARAFDLEICPDETPFALRVNYMAQPSGTPLTIVTNPILGSDGKPYLLMLGKDQGSTSPGIIARDYDPTGNNLVSPDEFFVFVSKRKKLR